MLWILILLVIVGFFSIQEIYAQDLSPFDEITNKEAVCLIKMLDLAYENKNVGAENKKFMSPKMQIFCGTFPHKVQCHDGLELIFKKSDNSPACVKSTTAEKLAERGWGGPPPPLVSHGGPAVDYVSLIDNLRANAIVNPEGEIEQPFFSVTGFSIQVNGASVQVFEYNSAEDAEADASLVSPNGRSIGTSMPFLGDAPHFYYKEKIIVLYVGDDPAIEELLEFVLGRQFAGG